MNMSQDESRYGIAVCLLSFMRGIAAKNLATLTITFWPLRIKEDYGRDSADAFTSNYIIHEEKTVLILDCLTDEWTNGQTKSNEGRRLNSEHNDRSVKWALGQYMHTA
jgi:hypothetical protein